MSRLRWRFRVSVTVLPRNLSPRQSELRVHTGEEQKNTIPLPEALFISILPSWLNHLWITIFSIAITLAISVHPINLGVHAETLVGSPSLPLSSHFILPVSLLFHPSPFLCLSNIFLIFLWPVTEALSGSSSVTSRFLTVSTTANFILLVNSIQAIAGRRDSVMYPPMELSHCQSTQGITGKESQGTKKSRVKRCQDN